MPQCIAAVFNAALEPLRALFSQPKGRHSSRRSSGQARRSRRMAEARRRRSTRVRRYAPTTPATPARLPSQPAVRQARDGADEHPRPNPPTALKPPSAEFDADEVALVRPYLAAHEAGAASEAKTSAEADRIQDRAAARLRAWGADLEFGPDTAFSFGTAPESARAYTLDEYPAPAPESAPERSVDPTDTFHSPAPRIPSPRVPARMDGLPHLSRIRARQQQRRARDLTGVGI